jgi:hypothetical protein
VHPPRRRRAAPGLNSSKINLVNCQYVDLEQKMGRWGALEGVENPFLEGVGYCKTDLRPEKLTRIGVHGTFFFLKISKNV